jgi:type I restriction enzyme S subunit
MNALGKPHGSIGRSAQEGITSPAYWVLECSEHADSRFLHYLLRSNHMVNEYQRLGKYLPPNQFNISWDLFRDIAVPLPPLEEQRRIAEFLDDQVGRIDAIVASRLKQVALTRDLIVSSVSKSLDVHEQSFGSARLAWGVRSIRQGWSPQCEDRLPEDEDWGVLRAGCVNGGTFRPLDLKTLPIEMPVREEYLVSPGDLLVNRASGSLNLIGSAALVGSDVRPRTLLSDKVYRLVLGDRWLPEYVVALWKSKQVRDTLRLRVSGAEGMANSLPRGVITSIRLPSPPRVIQLDWLDSWRREESRAHDALITLKGSIDILSEYKSSLITSAVTGQLDVTAAQPLGFGQGPDFEARVNASPIQVAEMTAEIR